MPVVARVDPQKRVFALVRDVAVLRRRRRRRRRTQVFVLVLE